MGVPGSVWRRLLPREVPVPLSVEVRRAVARRDWPVVQARLGAVRGQEREAVLHELGKVGAVRAWARDLAADDAAPSLALLLAAACHIQEAHEPYGPFCARCAPAPEQRPDPAALGRAERALRVVAEREPQWVEPWSGLFTVALGSGTDATGIRQLFDEVVRREPEHVGVHVRYVQQLGARHGGSDDEMHHFAHRAMARAPEGSPLGVVVASAHVEALSTAEDPDGHLTSPVVAQQVRHAADRSVRHPAYRRGPQWVWEHNVFAMMFFLTAQLPAAHDMFRVLGGRYSPSPWDGLPGDPRRSYRRARHRSGVWW